MNNKTEDFCFYNDTIFRIEYIGENFLDTVKSKKIYYQPIYSKIPESKVAFTKKVAYEISQNDSIINLIDHYNGVLLDFSYKKTSAQENVRFNIRCPHKAHENETIKKTVQDIGFGFSWDTVQRINNGMIEYQSQRFDALHIIGFSFNNKAITSIKYYFSLFDEAIIPDYNSFEKHHKDDLNYFYKIMDLLNINEKTVLSLKNIFDIMNSHSSYIDFIGVDFNTNGNKKYKIYYKANKNFEFINDLTNIINSKHKVNNDVNNRIKKYRENKEKIDYFAVAFSEDTILQYQFYLMGGEEIA